MIEEGKIILKFNINFKRQMIIVEDDKVSAMSYAEFFQCYFSSKRIGVIESDFTYSTFDELIEKSISLKVGTSQMATYISDDGINIIRFIFQKNEDDSAYCEIYKVQLINSNKDQLSRDYLTGVLSRGSLIKECENAMRNMNIFVKNIRIKVLSLLIGDIFIVALMDVYFADEKSVTMQEEKIYQNITGKN